MADRCVKQTPTPRARQALRPTGGLRERRRDRITSIRIGTTEMAMIARMAISKFSSTMSIWPKK